ncbi:hypothetical protein ACOME3_004825 [Neoechinorhynchus agilis]
MRPTSESQAILANSIAVQRTALQYSRGEKENAFFGTPIAANNIKFAAVKQVEQQSSLKNAKRPNTGTWVEIIILFPLASKHVGRSVLRRKTW